MGKGVPPSGSGCQPSASAAVPASSQSGIPNAGDVATIPYPFVRETYQQWGPDGMEDVPTWKPGVRFEDVGPEDVGTIADAVGRCIFTVVSAHKPGRFPTRVFFTRQFVNPDGRVFGKGNLHIVTLEKFRRLTRGYKYPFGLDEPLVADRWRAKEIGADFRALLAEYAAQGGVTRMGGDSEAGSVAEGHSTRSPSGDAPEPSSDPSVETPNQDNPHDQ